MALTLTQITDNLNGTVTVQVHDADNNEYNRVIGMTGAPDPTNTSNLQNWAFFLSYMESTITPLPVTVYPVGN